MLNQQAFPVSATRWLFALLGAFWVILAALLLTGMVKIGMDEPRVIGLLAGLMIGNAIVMGLLAWQALRGRRLVDYAAVAVVVANVVLTFTDEVGAYDLAYLAVTIALLAFLVRGILLTRIRTTGK